MHTGGKMQRGWGRGSPLGSPRVGLTTSQPHNPTHSKHFVVTVTRRPKHFVVTATRRPKRFVVTARGPRWGRSAARISTDTRHQPATANRRYDTQLQSRMPPMCIFLSTFSTAHCRPLPPCSFHFDRYNKMFCHVGYNPYRIPLQDTPTRAYV